MTTPTTENLLTKIHESMQGNQQEHQQQQKPFDFTETHVHICIPCYGGLMYSSATSSLIAFTMLANQVGLGWSIDFIVNESLVGRARNSLAAKMLNNKQATHLMFIDADIGFEPGSILQLIADSKEIIAGAYPKKGLPIQYNLNLDKKTKIQGPLYTVYTAATGFLLIKRNVLESLIEAHPEEKYKDDINLGKQYEPFLYNLFPTYVDPDPESMSYGHLLSEDWAFCLRAKKLGFDIWVDSRIKLDHSGTFQFQGDTSKLQLKPANPPVANPLITSDSLTAVVT